MTVQSEERKIEIEIRLRAGVSNTHTVLRPATSSSKEIFFITFLVFV